jgi:hypothetical protein
MMAIYDDRQMINCPSTEVYVALGKRQVAQGTVSEP